MLILGGPTSIFAKHLSNDELVDGLILLYDRLVDLGMECRNGQVYLADLEDYNAMNRRAV